VTVAGYSTVIYIHWTPIRDRRGGFFFEKQGRSTAKSYKEKQIFI